MNSHLCETPVGSVSSCLTTKDLIADGRLSIDLEAVVANYYLLAAQVFPARCYPVLKADAYGLGANRVGPLLYGEGCRQIFVAQMAEAMELSESLPSDLQLFVLNGIRPIHMKLALELGIAPVLNTMEQALCWMRLVSSHAPETAIVLQIDTGMTRLGLSLEELPVLEKRVRDESLCAPTVLLSHLACGDSPMSPCNEQQRTKLLEAASYFPESALSLANSAGCFLGPQYALDICRPGAALFGLTVNTVSAAMRPVVRLDLQVVQMREVLTGTSVGYGAGYTTTRPTKIATISSGYADGIPRNLAPPAGVWVGGQLLPILGKVCMDSFMVDATELEVGVLSEGQWVEFVGPHQGLEQLAKAAGTIGYEILTRLGRRYSRRYIEP